MTRVDPAAGGYGEPTRCPSGTLRPAGDHLDPPVAGLLDPVTEARQRVCPCHDAADCPEEATVTIPAAELSGLGELLTDIDELLRCGNGVAELLADFYAHRGHRHPRFAAANLIDAVGFTALGLRRRAGTEGQHHEGGNR